jgi:hypothetical protein
LQRSAVLEIGSNQLQPEKYIRIVSLSCVPMHPTAPPSFRSSYQAQAARRTKEPQATSRNISQHLTGNSWLQTFAHWLHQNPKNLYIFSEAEKEKPSDCLEI